MSYKTHKKAIVFTNELQLSLIFWVTREDTIVLNSEGSKDFELTCEQIRSIIVDPTTSEFQQDGVTRTSG